MHQQKIDIMEAKAKNISIRKTNETVFNIKSQTVILITLFLLGLIGSWSIGGLFLKEIAVAGVIINSLIIFRNFDNNNRKSIRSNK